MSANNPAQVENCGLVILLAFDEALSSFEKA